MTYRSPIFVALDTPEIEHARAIAQKVRHHVGGIKLGLEFFAANGRPGRRTLPRIPPGRARMLAVVHVRTIIRRNP